MLNRIIIMGRLTKDPEERKTPSGTAICKFSVAVNRSYKGKDGNKVEETDFFEVDAWGSTGETVGRYFRKGDMILVEGQMRNNNYTDSNGVKHYSMRLNADSISFCGNTSGQNAAQTQQNGQNAAPPQQYQGQPYQQAPAQQYGQPPQGYQQAPPPQYGQQQAPPPDYYPPMW